MSLSRRQFFRSVGLSAAFATLPALLGACSTQQQKAAAIAATSGALTSNPPTANADIIHLVSRITYGARPGEIERVAAMGWDAFLTQQLHPEQIDDSAMQQRLSSFSTLTMSNGQLLELFLQAKQEKKADKLAPTPTLPATETATNGQNASNGLKPGRISAELQMASLVRAISSERQLFEIMVDFWSNHLNISIQKQQARYYKTGDDRDVIRAFALGKFRDLLLASAKSPAMLVYLDNADNVKAGAHSGKGGLNENYAREVMELHTVGVDGGYTQDDITTVARALTGWGIAGRNAITPGTFQFTPRLHDTEPKKIAFLDLDLPAGGGIEEGEQLLARLANHPKTAARIAQKLCMAFVSDTPPQTLVDRATQTYLANDTDIRATLDMILRSDEFKASVGQKVKLPLRALVSMVRATGTNVDNVQALNRTLQTMGQPFFSWQSPNGYPQVGAAWVNTNGLLTRWNAAFTLAEGRIRGATVDLGALGANTSDAGALVDTTYQALLHAPPDAATRATLIGFVGNQPRQNLPALAGLLLASPEFQVY